MKPSRLSRWIARTLFHFSGYLPCKLIGRDGKPYLERYYLFSLLGLTAYLHRFVRDDAEEEVHNHPWRLAGSLVICGQYQEERLEAFSAWCRRDPLIRYVTIRWGNLIGQNRFHRIVGVRPETWTLFLHSDWKFGWGWLRRVQDQDEETLVYLPKESKASRWWLTNPSGLFTARQPLPPEFHGELD